MPNITNFERARNNLKNFFLKLSIEAVRVLGIAAQWAKNDKRYHNGPRGKECIKR